MATGEPARFGLVAGESSIETEMHSSLHPVHAASKGVTGVLEGTLGADGMPDLTAPHSARIELPVQTLLSGNRLQDMEMQRRLNVKQFPAIVIEVKEVAPGPEEGAYLADFSVEVMGRRRVYQSRCTVKTSADRLVVDCQHSFDMRDFGVNPPRFLTIKVDPEVNARIHLVASRV